MAEYKTHDFTKYNFDIKLPDLLAIQVQSWKDFLQEDTLPEKRRNVGLEAVLRNTFPIEDNHRNYVLEYKFYFLGLPKHSVKECLERRISYNVPLKVKFIRPLLSISRTLTVTSSPCLTTSSTLSTLASDN